MLDEIFALGILLSLIPALLLTAVYHLLISPAHKKGWDNLSRSYRRFAITCAAVAILYIPGIWVLLPVIDIDTLWPVVFGLLFVLCIISMDTALVLGRKYILAYLLVLLYLALATFSVFASMFIALVSSTEPTWM